MSLARFLSLPSEVYVFEINKQCLLLLDGQHSDCSSKCVVLQISLSFVYLTFSLIHIRGICLVKLQWIQDMSKT